MYYVLKYLISLLLLILGKLVVSSHREDYVVICVS
nr:MAG TPA_asm: hypothetical protein [Caudoviricetes sp.]